LDGIAVTLPVPIALPPATLPTPANRCNRGPHEIPVPFPYSSVSLLEIREIRDPIGCLSSGHP